MHIAATANSLLQMTQLCAVQEVATSKIPSQMPWLRVITKFEEMVLPFLCQTWPEEEDAVVITAIISYIKRLF